MDEVQVTQIDLQKSASPASRWEFGDKHCTCMFQASAPSIASL